MFKKLSVTFSYTLIDFLTQLIVQPATQSLNWIFLSSSCWNMQEIHCIRCHHIPTNNRIECEEWRRLSSEGVEWFSANESKSLKFSSIRFKFTSASNLRPPQNVHPWDISVQVSKNESIYYQRHDNTADCRKIIKYWWQQIYTLVEDQKSKWLQR
jgi:hypothetical protein